MISEVTASNVLITHVKSGKTRFVHMDRVKLFRGREDEAAEAADLENDENVEYGSDVQASRNDGQGEGAAQPGEFCMPAVNIDAEVVLMSDPTRPPPQPMPLPYKEEPEELLGEVQVKAEPVTPAVQEASSPVQTRHLLSEDTPITTGPSTRVQQRAPGNNFFHKLRALPRTTPMDVAAGLFPTRETRQQRLEAGRSPLKDTVVHTYPNDRRPSKRSRLERGSEEDA